MTLYKRLSLPLALTAALFLNNCRDTEITNVTNNYDPDDISCLNEGPKDLLTEPYEGNANAPVTVRMYGGFSGVNSNRFIDESYAALSRDYIEPGLVKLVFTNNYVPTLEGNLLAAQAGEIAHEQGKFWPMAFTMWNNDQALGRESLIRYATQNKLDVGDFISKLDNACLYPEVQHDLESVPASTPTERRSPVFTVSNGQVTFFVRGNQPDILREYIDELLR